MNKKVRTIIACVVVSLAAGCGSSAAAVVETSTPSPSATPVPTPIEYETSLFMTGDALIHSAVYKDAMQEDGSYDFTDQVAAVGRLSEGYDLKYYNQETILAGEELGYSNYPMFNTPQEMGDAMIGMGFNLVSLANNHVLDRYDQGIENSMKYWNSHPDVHTAGTYTSAEAQKEIPVYESNGITYTFLSWTYGMNGLLPSAGKEYEVNCYRGREDEMLQQVRDADEKSDVVIIAMHWGDEYHFEPNEEQETLARELSDAGADIIIGNHAHVIEPVEMINGKTLCFYAMGNMISAQLNQENLIGLTAGVKIHKTVYPDGSKTITLDDIRGELIYTYYNSSYSDFRIYGFDELNDQILPDYQNIEQKYWSVVTERDPDILMGMK